MQRQYEIYITQHNDNASEKTDAGRSFARIGVLFGSLVVALGLILIPVYIKYDSGKLMDMQQYMAIKQGEVMAAGSTH